MLDTRVRTAAAARAPFLDRASLLERAAVARLPRPSPTRKAPRCRLSWWSSWLPLLGIPTGVCVGRGGLPYRLYNGLGTRMVHHVPLALHRSTRTSLSRSDIHMSQVAQSPADFRASARRLYRV